MSHTATVTGPAHVADPHYGSSKLQEMRPLQEAEFDLGDWRVRAQPLEDRVLFTQKMYGVLIGMLLVGWLISCYWIFDPTGAQHFMAGPSAAFWLCLVVLVCQLAFHIAVLIDLYFGDVVILRAYVWVFDKQYANYIYILLFSICAAVCANAVLMNLDASVVCHSYLLTALLVLALLVYISVGENSDFSTYYAYGIVLGTGVILGIFFFWFCKQGLTYWRFLAVIFSIIFGWIIVYDTQQLYGTNGFKGAKYQFTTNLFGYAAYDAYLDFIFLPTQWMRLFSD